MSLDGKRSYSVGRMAHCSRPFTGRGRTVHQGPTSPATENSTCSQLVVICSTCIHYASPAKAPGARASALLSRLGATKQLSLQEPGLQHAMAASQEMGERQAGA